MIVPASHDESGVVLETSAPMFAASEDLRVVQWNGAVEALLGLTREEALGRACHEVLGCPEPWRRACADCFDAQLSTRSGETIWVNVTTLLAAPGAGAALRVHVLRELTPQKKLEELLRQVVSTASEMYFTPAGRPGERVASSPPPVTAREREVIRLLAQGNSTRAIAAKLGVTARTARNHIQNVFGKLGVHSRVEVVAYASSHGLV